MLCEDVTQGLSLDDDSVDVCVCSEVLEHIDEEKYPVVLKNIHRVLKQGGRFVVGFPINTRERQFHDPEKEKGMGHVNFPVYEDFIELARSVGFNVRVYDSSYSVKSSWRITKENRNTEVYTKIRDRLGAPVARAIMMTLDDNQTGGGLFTLEKR
jgi:predicted SAM-dependent methyltransferase